MRQSSANWHEALTSDGWTTHFIDRMPASLSLRTDHNTNYTQCSPAWLMWVEWPMVRRWSGYWEVRLKILLIKISLDKLILPIGVFGVLARFYIMGTPCSQQRRAVKFSNTVMVTACYNYNQHAATNFSKKEKQRKQHPSVTVLH